MKAQSVLVLLLSFTLNQWVAAREDCPEIPTGPFGNETRLHNPFKFTNGEAVESKGQWECRQAEISALLQRYELGVLPPRPTQQTASYKNGTLNITVTEGQRSITFTAKITLPSTGSAPFPAIIAIGGQSIPQPEGVAQIIFRNDEMAYQSGSSCRGRGKFYSLYGTSHAAGTLVAWTWGISRIIDALEDTPSAMIDTTRLAVTGCSRNGKGALVAGALEPRIALTIPQESNVGGTACWRLWLEFERNHISRGPGIGLPEPPDENCWFTSNFSRAYGGQIGVSSLSLNFRSLPFDHHLLIGLIAPRGLFAIDNSGIDWLAPPASYGCLVAAKSQWEALGIAENIGYVASGNHSHCKFPTEQKADLQAFIGKFLLSDESAITSSIANWSPKPSFNSLIWMNWTIPRLEDD